ncbi:hypothetical protein PINS_up018911 [Pythium insidiosum]|nr:hypothetical protein PINS_up000385 [Pythium insidiosum]GLE08015.1 hypothetical protein PINS_up018911 [Pythium insidiosum]
MLPVKARSAGIHELRCRYPGSWCQNPRAIKRNGSLHRLCEYHRTKANQNQKRVDQRKREEHNRQKAASTTTLEGNESHDEGLITFIDDIDIDADAYDQAMLQRAQTDQFDAELEAIQEHIRQEKLADL